jgi:predicted permease
MKIIIEQILILGIIGLIGFIAFKLKAISKENNAGLVKVIIKITLPLLIFTTFAGTKLNSEIISNFPYLFIAAIFSVSVLFLLSRMSAKILKLDKENTALHNTHTMFGNVVFLGFPLLNAIYPGGEGLIYATVFQLGHDGLMWTWGIFILNNGSKTKSTKNWKHLINPTTISFILGIIFLLVKIKIPELIFKPLSSIGHTTIYLSMIYVGGILAQVNAKSLISNLRSYILSFNKLILGPGILLLTFFILIKLGVNIPEKAIVSSVLQAAMPCMIIISVLAQEMGLNANQAVENIFVSSILSLITLPGVYWLATCVL